MVSFGLCVIGCGSFARTFAAALASDRGEIDLYFASRVQGKADRYCEEFGGLGSFGSYERAMTDRRVDGVYICTPHHLHLEHTRMASDAGKPVLLEKPLARNTAEAQAAVNAASDGGVTLMVAENYRFMPPVMTAIDAVQNGAVGNLRLIQLQEDYPFQPSQWRNDAGMNGGGVLIDGGIHKASLLAYIAGSPSEVYAAEVPSAQLGLSAEEGAVAMFRFPDGPVGVINHSWSAGPHRPRPWVTISGSIASVEFELGGQWIDTIDQRGRHRRNLGGDRTGLATMVREFVAAISDGRPPAMTGEEGIRDVALIEACYKSMQTGVPLRLP